MNRRTLLSLTVLLGSLLCLWHAPAQATRVFTSAQTPSPAEFDMGSTQTLTYTIANTSTISNNSICERIYEMRFRLPGTGTVFSSATAPPANWTRTGFSATSVTFRVNSWSNAIDTPPGGGKSCATGQGAVTSVAFNLVLVMRTTTADITETLRDARASYTLDTNFTNGITRSGRATNNNPGSWTLRALQITSIQTVDATTGVPVSSIFAGTSFKLVVTVKNISSTTLSGITANAIPGANCNGNPPTANIIGTVTPGLSTTVYSPNPLTLATGQSGTITLTYSTAASDSGTVSFSTYVCNSAKTAKSRQATSSVLSISVFVAEIYTSATCDYLNETFTVTMRLRNNSSCSIGNIAPTLAPTVGGIVTLVSGPTPATAAIGVGPGTVLDPAFQWTYQITGGSAGQLFKFSGSATGTKGGGGGCAGAITTPSASSVDIKRGGFNPVVSPSTVNAFSTNQNIEWSITNDGCGQVTKVEITVPAGFTWGGDGYAVVNANDETWGVSGTNPAAFDFTGANPIPLSGSGAFSLVLTTPPGIAVPTNYTFDVGITEDVTGFSTRSTSVTVNPFGSPSLNDTTPGLWREEFR